MVRSADPAPEPVVFVHLSDLRFIDRPPVQALKKLHLNQ
jgi:hypothetical protein